MTDNQQQCVKSHRAWARITLTREENNISRANQNATSSSMSHFTSLLAESAAAFVWPQKFESKPADVGILGHDIIWVLISLVQLPIPGRDNTQAGELGSSACEARFSRAGFRAKRKRFQQQELSASKASLP